MVGKNISSITAGSGRGGEESKIAFMQYMEVIATSKMVLKNFSFINARDPALTEWSTFVPKKVLEMLMLVSWSCVDSKHYQLPCGACFLRDLIQLQLYIISE